MEYPRPGERRVKAIKGEKSSEVSPHALKDVGKASDFSANFQLIPPSPNWRCLLSASSVSALSGLRHPGSHFRS